METSIYGDRLSTSRARPLIKFGTDPDQKKTLGTRKKKGPDPNHKEPSGKRTNSLLVFLSGHKYEFIDLPIQNGGSFQ